MEKFTWHPSTVDSVSSVRYFLQQQSGPHVSLRQMSSIHVWQGNIFVSQEYKIKLKTKLLSWTRFLALLDLLVETSSCSDSPSSPSAINSLSVGVIACITLV